MVFECYPISPGVLVDVTKARAIVQGRKPNARFSIATVRKLLRCGEASVKHRRPDPARLKKEPVLITRVAGVDVLFDGWHRAAYASIKGRKYLTAHRLTCEELAKCGVSRLQFKRLGKP